MTSPVLSQEDKARWTMSFSMPSKYNLETLPKPKNKIVKITQVQEKTIAAIRFSGFMSDYNFIKHKKRLQNWLDDNGFDYEKSFIRAGYNPPWTLPFFRRNEALFVIKFLEIF